MGKVFKYLLVALMAVSVGLVAWAITGTPEGATVETATAVGANLYWGYALIGLAIAVALLGAAWDLLQKPSGLLGAVLSFVAVVAIIVVAYVVANGHDYQILDIGSQDFFARTDTVIADASILVAYVAGAGAILSAIYSAISDALK